MGVGVRFDNCFGVYSCSWTIFIFYISFNSGIWFRLIFGVIIYFWGPLRTIFGVEEGFKHLFWVYSCSLTTFIFYDFFNSDSWIGLCFWVVIDFLGPKWTIFGIWVGFKNCLGSTHVVEQLLFSMFSLNFTFYFDLILLCFFTFWGPNGLILGSG